MATTLSHVSGPLAGKFAIVTGSSRGIGAAIARRLVDDGASVIVNYAHSAKAANALVQELNTTRPNAAHAIQADVSSVQSAKSFFVSAKQHFGNIDILVLNAGIMGSSTLPDVDEEYFDNHFNINVKGPFFLVQAAESSLRPGSRIIFLSSSLTHASVVQPTTLTYCAAKGAVEQLTRVLAKQLGPKGITVNCVLPGPIDTDLFRQDKTEAQIGFIQNMHPQKRLGQPKEVADVIASIASPSYSWVNGQLMMVNGGFVV